MLGNIEKRLPKNCMNEWTLMAVTSYGGNKNHDDEIKKNQEKANNSLSSTLCGY